MGFEARSWANGRRAMPFRLTLAIILMPSRRNMPLLSPPPLSLPCRQIPFFVHSRPLDGGGDADETVVAAACYLTRAARSGRSTVRARSSLWSIGPVSIDARRADRPRGEHGNWRARASCTRAYSVLHIICRHAMMVCAFLAPKLERIRCLYANSLSRCWPFSTNGIMLCKSLEVQA